MEPRFHIEVGRYCTFPANLQATLKKAALASVHAIPKSVAHKKLRHAGPYTLNLALVGEKRIRSLNKTFRGKDVATDVLSFSRLEGDEPMPGPLFDVGDVVICPTVAKKNAKAKEYVKELRTLTVHGVLHLFGYDHEQTPQEARKMERLQAKILETLN